MLKLKILLWLQNRILNSINFKEITIHCFVAEVVDVAVDVVK